ncbi:MAG: DUF2189 domain-containing protein [Lautropia sp.]
MTEASPLDTRPASPSPPRPPTADGSAGAAAQRRPFPVIRTVSWFAPLRWLNAGRRAFVAHPVPALFYGLCFAAMGWLLGALLRGSPTLMMALTCGFLLVGPLLAMGVYEIARRHDRGEPVAIGDTTFAWDHNGLNIAILGIALGVLMMLWARSSMMLIAIFFPRRMPGLDLLLEQLSSGASLPFLGAYVAVGAVFALLVFACSAIAIPLMLDRRTDAITAILASLVAVGRNPGAMVFWAVLIVALTAAGFASLFVGLIVTAPWLGLATWYAYRDLVAPLPPDDGDEQRFSVQVSGGSRCP